MNTGCLIVLILTLAVGIYILVMVTNCSKKDSAKQERFNSVDADGHATGTTSKVAGSCSQRLSADMTNPIRTQYPIKLPSPTYGKDFSRLYCDDKSQGNPEEQFKDYIYPGLRCPFCPKCFQRIKTGKN